MTTTKNNQASAAGDTASGRCPSGDQQRTRPAAVSPRARASFGLGAALLAGMVVAAPAAAAVTAAAPTTAINVAAGQGNTTCCGQS